MYLPPIDAFGGLLAPNAAAVTTITPSAIQMAAPFSYPAVPPNALAAMYWKSHFSQMAPPPVPNTIPYINDVSEPSGSSPANTTRTAASSNAGSDYSRSPASHVVRLDASHDQGVPLADITRSRTSSSQSSTPRSVARPLDLRRPADRLCPVVSKHKRKRAVVESDVEESSNESEYQDSGCDSDSESDAYSLYAERLPSRILKPITKKSSAPKNSDALTKSKAITKVTGPATKKARMNDGEAKDIESIGEFICGEIVKYKGKGSQYTMKGLRTPEVGAVCMMRCVNQTDMNRHRQKTLWHCEPQDRWTCEVCGKVMNARVDNQTRHARESSFQTVIRMLMVCIAKCKGAPTQRDSDDDACSNVKIKKSQFKKGKKRAYC